MSFILFIIILQEYSIINISKINNTISIYNNISLYYNITPSILLLLLLLSFIQYGMNVLDKLLKDNGIG